MREEERARVRQHMHQMPPPVGQPPFPNNFGNPVSTIFRLIRPLLLTTIIYTCDSLFLTFQPPFVPPFGQEGNGAMPPEIQQVVQRANEMGGRPPQGPPSETFLVTASS